MILHFVDARSVGGIESHIETTVSALKLSGQRAGILLYNSYPDSPFEMRLKSSGLEFEIAGGTPFGVYRALKQINPSVLHTHGYKANILGRMIARIIGVPCVSSFHAGERGRFPVNLYQELDVRTSYLSHRVAVSEPIARTLPAPSYVLRNFVSIPQTAITSHVSRKFAFAGRLSFEKGPDLFCELAKRCPRIAEWHVYGEGEMRQFLEQRYGGYARFHGHSSTLSAVFQRTGLLIMTSRNEGLPMAALEAMAIGVPVLAARVGDLPHLIDNRVNGMLFDAASIDDCVRQLDWFSNLTAHARLAMARAARKKIIDRYSAATVLPELLKIYDAASMSSLTRSISTKVQSSTAR